MVSYRNQGSIVNSTCPDCRSQGDPDRFALEAVSSLRSIWRLDTAQVFERFHVWHRGEQGTWSFDKSADITPDLTEIRKRIGDWYFSPHAYRPGRRSANRIVQLNAIALDLDGASLEDARTALEKFAIKPHWIIETSYHRWQMFFLLDPIRVGKESRDAILHRVEAVTHTLAEATQADLNATSPAQLFRLPGSRRETLDGIWTVPIFEQSSHAPYSLKHLERAVSQAQSPSTFRGYRRSEELRGRVMLCLALRWLDTHVILIGSRNTATTAVSYALAMDKVPIEEAERWILDWASRCLEGSYSERAVLQVLRSCYANPKGLSPEILASIQDINGETMSLATARSVYSAMPRIRQIHEALPIKKLKNRPAFEQYAKVLCCLCKLQKKNHGRPVQISTHDLAQQARIPRGTLERFIPTFNRDIRQRARKGRSYIAEYDLRRAVCAQNPYAFVESIGFRRSPKRVICYWTRRFKHSWRRFCQLLKALVAAFEPFPRLRLLERPVPIEGPSIDAQTRGPPAQMNRFVSRSIDPYGQSNAKVREVISPTRSRPSPHWVYSEKGAL